MSDTPTTTPDTYGPYFVLDSPYEVANWRPLVHWLMYIPHYVIVYVLQAVGRVVFFIYWLVLIFTGKLNRGLYDLMTLYERYNARSGSFLLGYSEIYPPFDFKMGPEDNNAYPPVTLTLPEPPEDVARSAALNWILAIPHYIVLFVYFIGAAIAAIIGWFAVLFTGKWPQGLRDFLVLLSNYYYRVWSYAVMVQNEYPKFGLPGRLSIR